MSDETPFPLPLLPPQAINTQAADAARLRVEGALTTANKTREEARAAYGTSVEGILRAIDDTTKALRTQKEGEWNLPLMAFGAGMLKGTPGVASNFLTELGSGMEAVMPVIARQRMSDREFETRIGELARARAEAAGMPAKLDMTAAEKERDRLLQQQQAIETATLRGIPAEQLARDKMAIQEAQAAAKMLEQMQQHAQSSVTDLLRRKEDISLEDQELLRRYDLQRRIDQYNRQPGNKPLVNPAPLTEQDIARAKQLMQSVDEKGLSETRWKALKEIRDASTSRVVANYDKDIWQSLLPDQQTAIIEADMEKRIEEYNKQVSEDKKIRDWKTAGSVDEAREAARKIGRLGEPEERDINAAGLPVTGAPNFYAGMPYKVRKEMFGVEQRDFNKSIATERDAAKQLAQRKTEAELAKKAYERSFRTGAFFGKLSNIGSPEAQEIDKVTSAMSLTNVPPNQGAVSNTERDIIKAAGPSRELSKDAFNTIMDLYVTAGERSNEYLDFKETWFKTHGTQMGADAAWNRYINSPQGMLIVADPKNPAKIMRNQNRLSWKEYFRNENAQKSGAAPAGGAPVERWDIDPNTGRPVKVQ